MRIGRMRGGGRNAFSHDGRISKGWNGMEEKEKCTGLEMAVAGKGAEEGGGGEAAEHESRIPRQNE